MAGDPAVLSKVSVKLDLGFLSMDTEWTADPRERQAAWELYVELVSGVERAEPLKVVAPPRKAPRFLSGR